MCYNEHIFRIDAPAFYGTSASTPMENIDLSGSVLGLVPHSIRGFLHSFEHILPAIEKYTNCVACSKMIMKEYEEHGMNFLMKVFNSSKHLEDVALLTEMFKETNFSEVSTALENSCTEMFIIHLNSLNFKAFTNTRVCS